MIEFFLDRSRLNYVMALFLLIAGIYSYLVIPKEIFPTMNLDKIMISGSYAGASADNLDKIAVTNIEDEIKNISGITKVESSIKSGMFSMVITLKERADKDDILREIKDSISKVKRDFPSDMDEPIATHLEGKIPLMQVSIASGKLGKDELLSIAKDIKTKLSKIEHLTDIALYGESDKEIKIELNTKKIDAYNLSKNGVISAISNLSYIYPIGKIEERGKHLFLSTTYGKVGESEYENSFLSVEGKRIRLKDIAKVSIGYPEGDTISSFNGENSFNINISKDEEGNSIELSRVVKNMLNDLESELQYVSIKPYSDTSVYIENRLNTVISNIALGFLLVSILMYFLINGRISIVVAAGIPFSFVIGLIFFNLSGNTINMVSLLGALIAIGVLVDDAIIVSENIQRHIEEGMPPKEAALTGAKEVIMPVVMATLTTMFAFIPMLLLSGEMGQFIKMIPIAISILIIASLIESFFFLPTHAKHLLKKESKTLSWDKVNNLYKKIINRLLIHKNITLIFFLIFIPLATVFGFKALKFQFFPPFDSTTIYINGKFDPSIKLEETHELVKEIERALLERKEELFIKSTTAVSGFRMSGSDNDGESAQNVFVIFVELYESIGENIVDKYITPILSFDFENEEKIRDVKTFELESRIKALLSGFKERLDLEELNIEGQRAGVVKKDIEIKLKSNDDELLNQNIALLREELSKIEGVVNIGDDAKIGIPELKIEINQYGESLGISEAYLAKFLSSLYLSSSKAKTFDDSGIVEIVTESINKDSFENFKDINIMLEDGKVVRVIDVINLKEVVSFEKIIKENGEKQKSLFGFVEAGSITSMEVIEKLKPTIEKIASKKGIEVTLGGEQEQTERMKNDMLVASIIALFLMFLSLLFMFDSFKYTFMILSIIPFSLLGVAIGHAIMGLNLTMPSIIGILGLAGVVINDGIVMLEFIRSAKTKEELLKRAAIRVRPIVLTSITTLVGLSTLIFFPSGQAKMLQPLAVSLGFGLAWGTILTLFYLPTLYAVVNKINHKDE